jgi:GTP-binding protein HflX
VESFKSTLDSVYRADLVLLVVDASESVEEMREKLVTCHDTLYERNEAPIVTVLNKIDTISDEELAEKKRALSALAPDPVAVSAATGENVEALTARIEAELPEWHHERLLLPMTEDTMSVVSWVHDHGHVEREEYDGDHVVLEFEAKPSIVERARAKATDLTAVEST